MTLKVIRSSQGFLGATQRILARHFARFQLTRRVAWSLDVGSYASCHLLQNIEPSNFTLFCSYTLIAKMEKEKSQQLTCLLMYHPSDSNIAKWLKKILQREGITCYLLFEVAGADLHKEMFRLADEADCVISLITQTLFDDEKCRIFHAKVYSYLYGEKYIAVRKDITDKVLCSPAGGFLEGCHVLAPEKVTDVEFQECLVSRVNAVARRKPRWDNYFQDESHIQPDVYTKSLNIPTLSKSDKRKFKVSQLSLEFRNNIGTLESTNQFSSEVVASEEGNAPETSIGLKENMVVAVNPPSSEDNGSGHNHAVSSIHPQFSISRRTDLANLDLVKALENSEAPEENKNVRHHISNVSVSESDNKSCSNMISDQVVLLAERKRVQQSPPTSLICIRNAYSESSESFETEFEPKYHSHSEGRFFLSMGDKLPVAMADRPTSGQHLHLECTLPHKPVYWKRVMSRKPPNRFLRSPFLLPILSIEQLPAWYRIATPYMTNGNLDKLLSFAKQSETDHSRLKLYLLRIIYQISEAICFLHNKGVFHGNIIPNNIVIDEQINARLGDYGLRRVTELNLPDALSAFVSTCSAKDADIFMFGITLWQILKCTHDRKIVEEELRALHALTELPTAEAMAADERHIEGKLWQLDSEETLSLCKILLQCLSKSREASMSDIKAEVKGHITKLELPLIDFPHQSCVHCMTEMPKQGLQARSSNCPQKCVFLNICPSCMPYVCSSFMCCPQHDSQIFPPFGGINSCALIISGRDQNEPETQDTFYKDSFEIALSVAHPHIMAIPWGNIYRISPWENSTEAEIGRVVHEIVQKKPDFFLFYYSGHKATEGEASPLDVSDKQGDSLNVEKLRSSLLQPLVRSCSRLLLILDCCYAASLWPLLRQEQYINDSHISFHTMWPSCGRKDMSNMPPNDEQSLFTKCLVIGLRGGRICPNNTTSCQVCQSFRNEIIESHCISKKILEKFVDMHMQCTFQEGRDDCQRSVIVESRRDSDPMIAYYRNQALYRFHYEPPKGQNFMRRVCELDSLDYNVDEVLQHLWNQLKDECLPNRLDHLTLQILRRDSDDSVHELSEVSDIIEAVSKDADSLYVSIRKDGENLGDKKWVACFCDEAQTEDAVRSLLDFKRNWQTTESRVKKVGVNEVDPTWKADDNNVFDETFQKCWKSFLSLKTKQCQLQQGRESFLQIEIREKLSMFSIATPQT